MVEYIDKALEVAYLPIISNRLNNIDTFISSIENTSKEIWGDKIIVSHAIGFNKLGLADEFVMLKKKLEKFTMTLWLGEDIIKACKNCVVEPLNAEVEARLKETSETLKDAVLGSLSELFDEDQEDYCGANKKKFKLQPIIKKFKIFNFDNLRRFVEASNKDVNFMICSQEVANMFIGYEKKKGRKVKTNALCDTMLTDDIQIVTYDMPNNIIYFVNSNDFKIHQLCDWQWLDENGKIVIKNEELPLSQATLIKPMNLVCHNPEKQIKVVIE